MLWQEPHPGFAVAYSPQTHFREPPILFAPDGLLHSMAQQPGPTLNTPCPMRYSLLVLALIATTAAAHAQIVAISNRLGYTGSIARYDSLADAQAGTNSIASASLDGSNRDLGLFITRGLSGFGIPSSTQIGTAWTATTTGPLPGFGNPNNVDRGFVQLPAAAGSLPSLDASWDGTLTTFTLQAQGTNAYAAGLTRLWNTNESHGQIGTFLNYDFSLVASGLTQATWQPLVGAFISQSEPTAVSGHFGGLFLNSSALDAAANGYYRFDFDLNLDSWVYANRNNLVGEGYSTSLFAAPTAVPEPATYGLFGVGALLALIGYRRFRSIRG